MKCFVASAFDHDDVDEIFDDGIVPVLRKLRILPFRVDRVEHNDDIDDRIYELMEQADFCIADLTHARPSVYYEAGYVFGSKKPVIYTARRDHASPSEKDKAGNLRVHFDLQMKNIIWWAKPDDTFRKRLARRVQYIAKPLLEREQANKVRALQAEQFAAMSPNGRLQAVVDMAERVLRSRGYSSVPTDDRPGGVREYWAYLRKRLPGTIRTLQLVAWPTITATKLRMFLRGFEFYSYYGSAPKPETYPGLKSRDAIYIVITLRPSKARALEALLPQWTPKGDKEFERQELFSLEHEIKHNEQITFIDGIESVEECAEKLRGCLGRLDSGHRLNPPVRSQSIQHRT